MVSRIFGQKMSEAKLSSMNARFKTSCFEIVAANAPSLFACVTASLSLQPIIGATKGAREDGSLLKS